MKTVISNQELDQQVSEENFFTNNDTIEMEKAKQTLMNKAKSSYKQFRLFGGPFANQIIELDPEAEIVMLALDPDNTEQPIYYCPTKNDPYHPQYTRYIKHTYYCGEMVKWVHSPDWNKREHQNHLKQEVEEFAIRLARDSGSTISQVKECMQLYLNG